MGKAIMRAEGLRKVFGSFVANDNINFEIEPGKVYALAGENGAGKSTLMKMIYGVYKIDGGKLFIDEEEMKRYNPSVAREKGIGMVFQDFRLVPAFTALENVFLSMSKEESGSIIRKKELRKKMNGLTRTYSLNVNPDEYVWRLDLGQRQHIEIMKVLMNDKTRILIFDEPTSVLAPNEIESFLQLLLTLRSNGFAIILITHKIHEIVQVADVVHILRKGKLVHTFLKADGFSIKAIVAKMIGEQEDSELVNAQKVFTGKEDHSDSLAPPVIVAKNITVPDDHGRAIIAKSDFSISPGMILGVAGISGNGQREFSEVLYGIRKLSEGRIIYNGEEIQGKKVSERLDMGWRMLSEDPIRDNMFPEYTVLQHMAICGFPYKKNGPMIDWRDLKCQMNDCREIKDLNVPEGSRRAEKLSGGNIQRMAFGRAILAHPKLFVACYPSRGLDIATVDAVHRTLEMLKAEGAAVIFISEDLNELFTFSDKLIVLSENRINGPYTPKDFDAQKIGEIMLKGAADQ